MQKLPDHAPAGAKKRKCGKAPKMWRSPKNVEGGNVLRVQNSKIKGKQRKNIIFFEIGEKFCGKLIRKVWRAS